LILGENLGVYKNLLNYPSGTDIGPKGTEERKYFCDLKEFYSLYQKG